jgi:hypothetical protein
MSTAAKLAIGAAVVVAAGVAISEASRLGAADALFRGVPF